MWLHWALHLGGGLCWTIVPLQLSHRAAANTHRETEVVYIYAWQPPRPEEAETTDALNSFLLPAMPILHSAF